MWPNLKQKIRAVFPKPKLIVYIGRSQKSFRTGLQPEKSPFTFQFSIPNFQIPNVQILKFQITNFSNSEFLNAEFQVLNFQIPNF